MTDQVVYCDESSHTNPRNGRFFSIGSLWMPRTNRDNINRGLRSVCKSRGIGSEIKWSKTSDLFLDEYKRLFDYFISDSMLRFRVILVDTTRVNYELYHSNDEELGFYKFYYQLICHWIVPNTKYLVLLDHKNNRVPLREVRLKGFLDNCAREHNSEIIELTTVDSYRTPLMQLCDLLTGAIAASANGQVDDERPKSLLIEYMKSKLGRSSLHSATWKNEQKFNVFEITLK